VPISREDTLYPTVERQEKMIISVFQGESPLTAKNIKLGALEAPLASGKSKAENGVNIRFTYDINGILQVDVFAEGSGVRRELILQQNPGVLTQDEIRTRLAALAAIKVHPRERQENLALIALAERLYEERIDQRDSISDMILRFRAALATQDEKLIGSHRAEFGKALDWLDKN
jgi:molecular chaperone HscC